MPANERKFWPPKRRHEHVLGEIRMVSHGDRVLQALYLYEQSVEQGMEPAPLPPFRARAILGTVLGLTCTICGEMVDWYAGQDMLDEIVRKRQERA